MTATFLDKIKADRFSKLRIASRLLGLACAPVGSPDGARYLAALAAAANYAFVNRQLLGVLAVRAMEGSLRLGPKELGMRLVYDVGHNNAKFERHAAGGRERLLLVHRKGATRAFGPDHPALPARYRKSASR